MATNLSIAHIPKALNLRFELFVETRYSQTVDDTVDENNCHTKKWQRMAKNGKEWQRMAKNGKNLV